jgi:hypothetical protein
VGLPDSQKTHVRGTGLSWRGTFEEPVDLLEPAQEVAIADGAV